METEKSVGERLKGERTRLGYNIRDFAEKGGVSKSTQSNYENDASLPDSSYLNKISALGAEIFWIMRGSEEDDEVREKRASLYPPEIRELIEHYNDCPGEVKAALRVLAKNAANYKRKQVAEFKKQHGSSAIQINLEAASKPAEDEIDLMGEILGRKTD